MCRASALSLPVHMMTHALMVMSFMNRRSLREETRAAVGGTGEAWSSTAEPPDAALFAQTPGEGLPVRGAQRPRHSHPRPNFWPSADQGPCERVSVPFRFFDFYWLEMYCWKCAHVQTISISMCLIYRSEEDEGFPAVAVERLLLERIWEQEPTPPGESLAIFAIEYNTYIAFYSQLSGGIYQGPVVWAAH